MTPDRRAWEPWQPQIGDRVRVRLSGECLQRGRHEFKECHGATGYISDVVRGDGHDYMVRYDPDIPIGNGDTVLHRDWFAAVELEPLPGGGEQEVTPW